MRCRVVGSHLLAKGFETENSSITTVAELTKPVETIFHVRNDGQRKTPGPFLVKESL